MRLHRPNTNKLFLGLILCLCTDLACAESPHASGLPAPEAKIAADNSAATAPATDPQAATSAAAKTDPSPQEQDPALKPASNTTQTLAAATSAPTAEAPATIGPNPTPAAQATMPQETASSTNLAAPLNAESARTFSGQEAGSGAIDLHPPGRFTTAEPLNPSTENLLKPDPAAPPPAPLAPAAPLSLLGATLNPGSASRLA
ncbi:MAG TPA: hypothetical protein PKD17_19130, partial [Cellvibrionaceae bacterium]|nr:hypothetical protein [Cellvibrionaceae bacterium]